MTLKRLSKKKERKEKRKSRSTSFEERGHDGEGGEREKDPHRSAATVRYPQDHALYWARKK